MRTLRTILLLVLAALLGAGAGEAIYRSGTLRGMVARVSGRNAGSLEPKLREASRTQVVGQQEIDRELELLHAQFNDEPDFQETLVSSGYSLGEWRTEVAAHLQALAWIEQKIAPELRVTDEEANQFYAAHREEFAQPQRYRASHIFRAAPESTPPETVTAQQNVILGLAVRMLAGEPFAQLAAEGSEDEATKLRGGDLNYFAATRMPPEFMTEVVKLQPGQISGSFKTHLGFHIVQLTDAKPPAEVTFEQAGPEILLRLTNEKRKAAVARLHDTLVVRR
jgi:hypothetical protein